MSKEVVWTKIILETIVSLTTSKTTTKVNE